TALSSAALADPAPLDPAPFGAGGSSVVVTSPPAGAESSYRQSVIRWQPIAGASSYHLEIDDDPNFRSPEVDTVVTDTFFALNGTALKLNGQRSWPAYVRINGERWNAGTFAPAEFKGAWGGPSVAVAPDGTVHLTVVVGTSDSSGYYSPVYHVSSG